MNSIENNVKKFPVKIIPVVAQLRQRIKQKKGEKKKKWIHKSKVSSPNPKAKTKTWPRLMKG
jgi:hypothetical protein